MSNMYRIVCKGKELEKEVRVSLEREYTGTGDIHLMMNGYTVVTLTKDGTIKRVSGLEGNTAGIKVSSDNRVQIIN